MLHDLRVYMALRCLDLAMKLAPREVIAVMRLALQPENVNKALDDWGGGDIQDGGTWS